MSTVRPREVILGWGIIGNVCQSSEKDNEIQDGYRNTIMVNSYPKFSTKS